MVSLAATRLSSMVHEHTTRGHGRAAIICCFGTHAVAFDANFLSFKLTASACRCEASGQQPQIRRMESVAILSEGDRAADHLREPFDSW